MSNEAIKLGVAAVNSQAQEHAAAQVVAAWRSINGEKARIGDYENAIKGYREELKALELDLVTDETVLGRKLSVTGNPNAETMVKAIAQVNEMRQANVKQSTDRLAKAVVTAQDAINACNDRIAAEREKLSKLTVATVTEADVMTK